jgi:hypothetical protein
MPAIGGDERSPTAAATNTPSGEPSGVDALKAFASEVQQKLRTPLVKPPKPLPRQQQSATADPLLPKRSLKVGQSSYGECGLLEAR